MTVTATIVNTLLALIAAGSAAGKLTRRPPVIDSLHGVGISDPGIRTLALLDALGAAGLAIGIWIPLLGIAAAIALSLYFLGAIAAHLRVHDPVTAWMPAFGIFAIGVAASVLQLQR
jgi:hypothetical protein